MLARTYITFSELFDRQPSLSEVVDIVEQLPMRDAAFALCKMNLALRFAMQEQDRPNFGRIQQQLIGQHTDDEVFRLLQQRFPHVSVENRPIFLPHGVLNVLRLVLTRSRLDVQPNPSDDATVRFAIGRACLMMNNLLVTTDEERQILKGPDEERRIELLVQTLAPFEIANPPKAHHLLFRLHIMYRMVLKDGAFRSAVECQCDGLDFEKAFQSLVGISVERWLFVIFGVYAYFIHGANPLDPHPEFALLNPLTFPGESGITSSELETVLKTLATSLSSIKAALTTEGGTDPRYDFVPFRARPLYAIDEGKLLPSDISFILEKCHAGVQWAIHDALPADSKKRNDLFTAWGILFEQYVHWLLGGMQTSIPMKYIQTPQWDTGGESFDGLLLKDSVLMPAEYKGGFLSRSARYSGDKDIFLDDVEKKFVPGCDQLAKKIGALFAEDAMARRHLKDLPLDHIRAVIPTLVVQDHVLRVPFLNWYMNKKFQETLNRFNLRPGVLVRPLTVVNIQELESMVNSAEGANFDFVYALHNRTVRDEEVLSDLLDWLMQFPDFGRLQSPRMRQILDELHGPMFTYLFPKSAQVV